jgi:acetyltransferase-like isoleucine patch superfamily enzyme
MTSIPESTPTATGRRLPDDWHDGYIPANVVIEEGAFVETSYSFLLFRSEAPEAVRFGRGSTTYLGSMFDLGPRGRVSIGDYSLINGAWFLCDSTIEIGDYALISWNVVFMDSYGVSFDPATRRNQLAATASDPRRLRPRGTEASPIRLGRGIWIGFDCIILPGVSIGDGAIVGARSVVTTDVPAFTVAAGNPARVIRKLENDEKAN